MRFSLFFCSPDVKHKNKTRKFAKKITLNKLYTHYMLPGGRGRDTCADAIVGWLARSGRTSFPETRVVSWNWFILVGQDEQIPWYTFPRRLYRTASSEVAVCTTGLQSACHRLPVLLYRYNMLLFAFLDIIYFIPLLFYHICCSFQADRLLSVISSKILYLQSLIIRIVPSYHLSLALTLFLSHSFARLLKFLSARSSCYRVIGSALVVLYGFG